METAMPTEQNPGCERPAPKVEKAPQPEEKVQSQAKETQGGPMIRVGQKAPDFTASAYVNGGFGSVTLSEYLGRWVVLCFYPGDFTFV